MDTIKRIEDDSKKFLKAKDNVGVSTLRLLKSAVQNKKIDLQKELTEEEVLELVLKEIKKRKESSNIYEKAGRNDLAQKEEEEIAILQRYAPKEIPPEELEKIIKEEISQLNAKGPGDIGRVMGKVMPRIKGRADGGLVSQKVTMLLK